MNELEYAIRESAQNESADAYFVARRDVLYRITSRVAFEAGFLRGWDAALEEQTKAITQPAPPAPPTKPKTVSISVNGGEAIELALPDGGYNENGYVLKVNAEVYWFKDVSKRNAAEDFMQHLLEGKL